MATALRRCRTCTPTQEHCGERKLEVTSRQRDLLLLAAASLTLSDSLTYAVALEVSQRRESSLGGPQWHQSIIAERWRKGSRGITHIRLNV